MSQPLTDAINALTTYANSVTGASDTTLSDAVDSLVAGYGGGGGESISDEDYLTSFFPDYDFSNAAISEFVLETDQRGTYFSVPNPAGEIPVNYFAIRKNIWELTVGKTLNYYVVGGYNIGNITTDNVSNRLIRFTMVTKNSGETLQPTSISKTDYTFKSTRAPENTETTLYLRSGDTPQNTLWAKGTYVLAVFTE